MANDLMSYEQYMAEHEAKEKYKEMHPEEYPWFAYFRFGLHNITYLTDEETKTAVNFYHLAERCTDDGRKEYYRDWNNSISIMHR